MEALQAQMEAAKGGDGLRERVDKARGERGSCGQGGNQASYFVVGLKLDGSVFLGWVSRWLGSVCFLGPRPVDRV